MAKLHKEYLLDARIDADKNGTLSERLDYAWKVFNSPLEKYQLKHKLGSLDFLRRTFKELSDEQISVLMRVKAENPEGQKDYIPDSKNVDSFLIMRPIKSMDIFPMDYIHLPADPFNQKQDEFIAVANSLIVERNSLINQYNHLDTFDKKKKLMPHIFEKQREILSKFPPIEPGKTSMLEKEQVQLETLFTDLQFIHVVNARIDELNELIKDYNQAESCVEKKTLMIQLYNKQKTVLSEFPPVVAGKFPEYVEKIQRQLFTDIQLHLSRLGVNSLQELVFKPKSGLSCGSVLSEIIANMPPHKLDELARILSGEPIDLTDEAAEEKPFSIDKKAFNELYKKDEPGYKEYQQFLATHSCSFLGGHNSRNFKIKPITGESFVLKLENRLTAPKLIETELKNNVYLSETFIWSTAERQASFLDEQGQQQIRTVMTMPFCKGSDLEHNAGNEMSQTDRVRSALSIYTQMATIIDQLNKGGFAFPDMKNGNWLMDNAGRIRIADAKSISYTDDKGALDYSISKNYWYGGSRKEPITSRFMMPPEFFSYITQLQSANPKPFSCNADKMHSFMLGLNLYQYLTQCGDQYLYTVVNRQYPLNFSDSLFKSQKGQALQGLITDLTHTEPKRRMSIESGLAQLKAITEGPNPTEKFRDRLDKIVRVRDNLRDALAQPNIRQ